MLVEELKDEPLEESEVKMASMRGVSVPSLVEETRNNKANDIDFV